jgi:FAD/FMN-containing dehydrogenase
LFHRDVRNQRWRLKKRSIWRNWVGSPYCVSQFKAAPSSQSELVEFIKEADKKDFGFRVSGSGRSFAPVIGPSGALLSLEKLRGVQNIDRERNQVTVAGGTRLNEISKTLKEQSLSLINLGDIPCCRP